jgi:hypothetical protein
MWRTIPPRSIKNPIPPTNTCIPMPIGKRIPIIKAMKPSTIKIEAGLSATTSMILVIASIISDVFSPHSI